MRIRLPRRNRKRGPRGPRPKLRGPKIPREKRIIGIDGEGVGRGPHRYLYLAGSDEWGKTWDVRNASGLGLQEILDWLLALPEAIIVGYFLGYDITKWIAELSNKKIHRLLHPERRRKKAKGRTRYEAVRWGDYRLNFMNGRFSVAKFNGVKVGPSTTVWDIGRFFQSRFTKALVDWEVATESELSRMALMKGKRASFIELDIGEVESYCREECTMLAKLFRKLLEAHSDAGLKLKSYYGAGSTSSALLETMGIKSQKRDAPPEVMRVVPYAFSAGRFEDAVQGPIGGPSFEADISSAYPYHATFLPCLGCGAWEKVQKPSYGAIRGATLALVSWTAPQTDRTGPWGPFPVRTKEGAIIYPWSSPGGWVWGNEFLTAKECCPHVEATEAWLYHTDCDHRPFGKVPEFYLERIRVGKNTGPGKVWKLGPNGIYGKLAQTVGDSPPYQSFILAGVITSNTRAQLWDGLGTAPLDIHSVATDGIRSASRLTLPSPRDTGTGHTPAPLGGWEQPDPEGARFYCRPGISFPLENTGKVKSRGYSKTAIEEQAPCIQEAWKRGHEFTVIDDGEQFGGALATIHLGKDDYTRSEKYGEWFRTFTIMSFDPAPKRVRGEGGRLDVIPWYPHASLPYDPAIAEENISPHVQPVMC